MKGLIILFSLLSLNTFALDCSNPQTTLDMNLCSVQDGDNINIELEDKLYSLNHGDETAARLTSASQKAWQAFRDIQCEAEAYIEAGGGSAETSAFNRCQNRLTKERIEQLEKLRP